MSPSLLVLAAHDERHPQVTGGDLHLEMLARELSQRGWKVAMWTGRSTGLATEEDRNGVHLRRWSGGPLFPVRAFLSGARDRSFDLVLEQVIGSSRVPFFARLWTPRRSVGFWYQDNRPLFRSMFSSTMTRSLASGLQEVLRLAYEKGPLLSPSETTRSWLISEGVRADRVAVSHPQVIVPPGAIPRPYSARSDCFVSIGNFRRTKRFEEALEVLRRLRTAVPTAELHLLGRPQDARYLDVLRARAEEPDLRGHVHFSVGPTEEEKFAVLAGAKALTVHSSIEGFGWTVPEAGAMGVPAIVPPGVPVDVGKAGEGLVRVAAGDLEGYVRPLERWMRSEEDWRRSSGDAQERARAFQGSFLPAPVLSLLETAARGAGGTR